MKTQQVFLNPCIESDWYKKLKSVQFSPKFWNQMFSGDFVNI